MKKPHKKKPPLSPQWEDEEPEASREQLIKQEQQRQEDAERMFLDAVERGPVITKDKESASDSRTKSGKSRAHKASDRHEIDLHGMTVDQARRYVIAAIDNILAQAKGQPVDIRVITGKGHNSKGQPQLISSIHHVVEARFKDRLINIEVSPHELQIGGTYIKGHFDMKIR
jgi:DNA-nicking Smr family endonuclease